MDGRPIGVFDSGVGGISVLREMTRLLPSERFLYYGDSQSAPYGVREESEIRELTIQAVDWLLTRDVKALVIACNTATSAAAEALRERLSIPVIGMEPALKPAAEDHVQGRILVMATPATLRQQKFQGLMARYGKDASMVPCGGLMEFVERGELSGPTLRAYLMAKFAGPPVESVVLGCTHYVFLKSAVQEVLPHARLYDGNLGAVRQLEARLGALGALRTEGEGSVDLHTSGGEGVLDTMRMLLAIKQ